MKGKRALAILGLLVLVASAFGLRDSQNDGAAILGCVAGIMLILYGVVD